jgi:chemotaxis protein methyltransferase CheR
MTVGAGAVPLFRTLLADRLGLAFVETDVPRLAQVLSGRADWLGLSSAAYLRHLGSAASHGEITALAEELTITETYFFRHTEQFRALAEAALPQRVRARADQRVLQLLSIGCSSGEEPYSLAIAARQAQPDPAWQISVLGLDANPAMLRRCARARYSSWSLRETSDAVRQRWFRAVDHTLEPNPDLRAIVQFDQHNVADRRPARWHAGQYDVVFCRNLLMYLTPPVAAALVRRMTNALAPGGYLFLGHTDSLGSHPDGLEPQRTHGTFYYRRPPDRGPDTAHAAAGPTVTRADRSPTAGDPAVGTAGPGRGAATARGVRQHALLLLRDERFTEALAVVEAALPDEASPDDLLLHGVLLAQAGRLPEAELLCRRQLDTDGMFADAQHLLGVCLDGGADVDGASRHYRLAAYLDPDFAMPRLRLGLLARRIGDERTAGAALERALDLLRREQQERITLFGGGFGRAALVALCRAELDACGVPQ